MNRHDATAVAFLNDSALTDAVSTRAHIIRLLRSLPNGERSKFIEELAARANSRLRQAVARAVQIAGYRTQMVPVFEAWLATETDEFARNAIADALTPIKRPNRRKQLLSDLKSVPETYRYLYDRIRHRVLNAMPGAGLSVMKLKDIARQLPDDQHRLALLKEIDALSATFSRIQRAIEFQEEKSRFEAATFDVAEWLNGFIVRYRAQWEGVDIRFATPDEPMMIIAIRYLLETALGNLLDNSRQAIDSDGWIWVDLSVADHWVHIGVLDSGKGIPGTIAETAFKLPVTTKGTSGRGRGFMEVDDAMRRLGGRAEIIEDASGARVRLALPVAS